MRKTPIVVALAAAMTMAFTGVASAHTLKYRPAKKLAVQLAEKQEREQPVERWRIFGAERISDHEIVWVYNVDYADGTLCDAELVVRLKTRGRRNIATAKFRDVHCER